ALLDAGELVSAGVGPGFRIRDVDRVVRVDEDPARPPELPPFVDERAVLIEDLDAVVLPVADIQAPARVHRNRVRLAELAAAGSLPAPLLDERAVLREPHDAVVLPVPMAVGDEDVAARRHDDVSWLVEEIRGAAPAAR